MSKIEIVYQLYQKSNGVNTDTRSIKKGEIFIALKGENFNGNLYAKKALDNGALAVVCDEEQNFKHHSLFVVENALVFLQQLANYHRKKLNCKVIAITGSNGKTTTKELMRDVLATTYKTQATVGNFNNHIGVPLTLLSLKPDVEMAIIEMGANHLNEIAALCAIAEPDYGYITNFGKAHLEGFGGLQGVIKGKSELYNFLLKSNGSALIDLEDDLQRLGTTNIITKSFGSSADATFNIENLSKETVSLSLKTTVIKTQLIGYYNYSNVCAAAAFGLWFNIDIHKIKQALESYLPKMNRSEITKTDNNTLLLDAYNANPSSMKASILNFRKLNHINKMMILGDMFELGDYSKKEHQDIFELAKSLDLELILVGEHFSKVKNVKKTLQFKATQLLAEHLQENPIKNHTILLKGSRSMKLETLKDYL